ncbi:MAG: MerR family transcriptional regulator [Solirubrobacteraceae bacterium]|nr:MerR family transcriptional regulator [Solirubrobacteraceae bacterium]
MPKDAQSSAGGEELFTTGEVADLTGISAATLRRWYARGLFPGLADGEWTPAAIAQARTISRMRDRGHSVDDLVEAVQSGRMIGYVDELANEQLLSDRYTLEEASKLTGLDPETIRETFAALGLPEAIVDNLNGDDVRVLSYLASSIESGFPREALLQAIRVYGQSIARIADAEVRLLHLHVHEPLLREGAGAEEINAQLGGLASNVLPLSLPTMDYLHRRYLTHYLEQEMVTHLENDEGGVTGDGRLLVAIAFADLAGYTQLTEELGDEEAAGVVERFVESVRRSIPDQARIVKTIGDEVMLVANDARSLAEWAVAFQTGQTERPLPRIGIHAGEVVYRDGDYFGREVNLAARVVARAAAGEVLVTWPVVEASGRALSFDLIGEVKLKGFSHATELFLAHPKPGSAKGAGKGSKKKGKKSAKKGGGKSGKTKARR